MINNNSFLGKHGYTIQKSDLNEKEIAIIKKDFKC